jgi:hypothetical protein
MKVTFRVTEVHQAERVTPQATEDGGVKEVPGVSYSATLVPAGATCSLGDKTEGDVPTPTGSVVLFCESPEDRERFTVGQEVAVDFNDARPGSEPFSAIAARA